jgi:hypothetical protein
VTVGKPMDHTRNLLIVATVSSETLTGVEVLRPRLMMMMMMKEGLMTGLAFDARSVRMV